MLEEVGFSREQAETSIKVLTEVMEDKLATKEDVKEMRSELRQLELRLLVKAGAMQTASVAIIVALIKLI